MVKKQELKKERLIGSSGKLDRNSKTSGISASNSLSKKKSMKILPQHFSQHAARKNSEGISGARVFNADESNGDPD